MVPGFLLMAGEEEEQIPGAKPGIPSAKAGCWSRNHSRQQVWLAQEGDKTPHRHRSLPSAPWEGFGFGTGQGGHRDVTFLGLGALGLCLAGFGV